MTWRDAVLEPRAWLHAFLVGVGASGSAALQEPQPHHLPEMFVAVVLLARVLGAVIGTKGTLRRRPISEQVRHIKQDVRVLTNRIHKMNNDVAALVGEVELLEVQLTETPNRKGVT